VSVRTQTLSKGEVWQQEQVRVDPVDVAFLHHLHLKDLADLFYRSFFRCHVSNDG
jgi:hypothetical protein